MKYRTHEARKWVRDTLNGYVTVLYTPFREDGEIDEPALRAQRRAHALAARRRRTVGELNSPGILGR